MAEENKVKITIRQNSGQQFDVHVDPTASINDLKEACVGDTGLQAEEMRLIFKGKILKDEQNLTDYKIETGCTVHLVKGKSAGGSANVEANVGSQSSSTSANVGSSTSSSSQQQNPFGGMGGLGGLGGFPSMSSGGGLSGLGGMNMDPNQMQQMMNNPMVQQMMSDPAMLQQIIGSNPMLSQMVNSNPQLQAMLQNPDMMRMMFSPEAMGAAMQMMQGSGGGLGGGLGALGGQPGSFQMPGGSTSTTQSTTSEQTSSSTNQQQQQQQNPFGGSNPYAMFGNPMMNPYMMGGLGGGFGGGLQQQADTRPPKEKYATQLQQIKEMGFLDEEAILQVLEQTKGNVQLALEVLFQSLGN